MEKMKKILLFIALPLTIKAQETNLNIEARATVEHISVGIIGKKYIGKLQLGAYQTYGTDMYSGVLFGYNIINEKYFKLATNVRIERDFLHNRNNICLPSLNSVISYPNGLVLDYSVAPDLKGVLFFSFGVGYKFKEKIKEVKYN